MRVGTRSVLFGAHQFILHPLYVAKAWRILYGRPTAVKLWVAFFVHDLGYIGKPNMDGPEGEDHPELGGRIMDRLFGRDAGDFTRFHSRTYARKLGRGPSNLCAADKLATALYPLWLYCLLLRLTGEYREYMEVAEASGFYGGRDLRGWAEKLRRHFVDEAYRMAGMDFCHPMCRCHLKSPGDGPDDPMIGIEIEEPPL